MRLFICGPRRTSEGQSNRAAFVAAELVLRALGYHCHNPARRWDAEGNELGQMGEDWHALAECDGVALLECWQADTRALQEKMMANDLGLPVQALDTWPRLGPALPVLQDPLRAVQAVGIANAGRRPASIPAPAPAPVEVDNGGSHE